MQNIALTNHLRNLCQESDERRQSTSKRNSTSEKPGGQAEQEAPSSTAKSRTITLCGVFNLPEADADEDDDPDWW